MRRHLLYVGSAEQVAATRASFDRLRNVELVENKAATPTYKIEHPSLRGLSVFLSVLNDFSEVVPHLRQSAVDLLIYDERAGGADALRIVAEFQEDLKGLANLWGADFHFPMRRVVAILNTSDDSAARAFALGRFQVKDVLIAPPGAGAILRWVVKLLRTDMEHNAHKVGLIMSGGGMEGLFFQVGCAYAIDSALKTGALQDSDVFSGISSGSIAVSLVANRIPTLELVRSLKGVSQKLPAFKSSMLYDLAGTEIARRIVGQMSSWSSLDPNKWMQKALQSIPTGFFKGEALMQFMEKTFQMYSIPNEFSKLDVELFIGVTHQDTFEHVELGLAPWDRVSISDAVRASSALPPFFVPHKIEGQGFIDGQITQGGNFDLMVQRGCNLIIIIDPMLPYTTLESGSVDSLGGLNTVIQALKSLVYTRFRSTLAHATERYPDVDFMVFQPFEECAQVMSGSPMKIRANLQIVDLAYTGTLRRLRERHQVYSQKLGKFGFALKSESQLLSLERQGLEIR